MPDQQPLHPAPTPLRCRCLTVKGFQCKHPALFGHDLCYHHFHNRRPTLPPPEQASAPFLDDPASIQLLLTQIAHGLLSRQLPADIARALSYTCQVAMNTLPRPLAPRFKPSGEKPRLDEPILAVVPADNGEPLAPSQKYAGPTGTFEPTWSVSKFFYEQECERNPTP